MLPWVLAEGPQIPYEMVGRGTVLLPWVIGEAPAVTGQDACLMVPAAETAETGWFVLLGERAERMRCSDKLIAAAQAHAEYLMGRTAEQYHDSLHLGLGGSTPNERVCAAGYRLPTGCEPGNYVESAVYWPNRTLDGMDGLLVLMGSPPHRAHLMGEGWYEGSVVYGIGVSGSAMIILAAPPEAEGSS